MTANDGAHVEVRVPVAVSETTEPFRVMRD